MTQSSHSFQPSDSERPPVSNRQVFAKLNKLVDRVRRLDQRLVEQVSRPFHAVGHAASRAFEPVSKTPFRPVVKGFLPWLNQIAALQGKSITVGLEIEENVEILSTHVKVYQQIIYHLLQNALTHGIEAPEKRLARGKERKGSIKVQFETLESTYRLTIRDDGTGLSKGSEQSSKLAMPVLANQNSVGETSEPSVESLPDFIESSLGLGLHLVRRNVQMLQGELDIETRAGRETIITVLLPRV